MTSRFVVALIVGAVVVRLATNRLTSVGHGPMKLTDLSRNLGMSPLHLGVV